MKKYLLLLLLFPTVLFGQISNKILSNPIGLITLPVGYSYTTASVEPTLVGEAASGTHNCISSLIVKPIIIGNAGATTSKSATIRIEGANTQGLTSGDYAIFVKQGVSAFGGNVKIGDTTNLPLSLLDLAAGNTLTAPLKFNSGSLVTAQITGLVEFLTDDLYFTITTGTSRKKLVFQDASLTSGKMTVSTTNGRLIDALNSDVPAMSSTVGGGVPTPPNDGTKYLNGTGNWTVPAGSGSGMSVAADATDADYTAVSNSIKYLPLATLTANRTITIPAGTNGDLLEIYNNEIAFVWNLSGSSVYLSDGSTVVASLLANTNYIIRKVSGKWRISN